MSAAPTDGRPAAPPRKMGRGPGRSDPLPAQTDRTITTREELKTELQRVRRRGYASNAGESEDGVGSIGAAVLNSSGRPVAAVSVAAPLSRMPVSMARQVAEPLTETARRISAQLS